MTHPIYSSRARTLAFTGFLALCVGAPIAGIFGLYHLGSSNPTPTASKPETEQVAQVSRPRIDANLTTYQGQLMTDYEVGKVLGDIKCGKRPVGDGIDFLNVNGVPKALLENQTPELREGYRIATAWC